MTEIGTNIVRFLCKDCQVKGKQTLVAGRIPLLRLFNFPDSSGLIMTHERMTKCQECGTGYVPIIKEVTQEATIKFAWRQVTPVKDETTMTSLTGNSEIDTMRKKLEKEKEKYERGEAGKTIQ